MTDITTFLVIQEPSAEQKREELQKYGIFFDDEYDYLQHLKDVNEVYELEEHVPRENKVRHHGMSVCDSNIHVYKQNKQFQTIFIISLEWYWYLVIQLEMGNF